MFDILFNTWLCCIPVILLFLIFMQIRYNWQKRHTVKDTKPNITFEELKNQTTKPDAHTERMFKHWDERKKESVTKTIHPFSLEAVTDKLALLPEKEMSDMLSVIVSETNRKKAILKSKKK